MRAREYRTPVKTRILAGGIHSAKQQIVRIDREAGSPLTDAGEPRLHRKIRSALDGCDAVLLSDYGSGLVTPALADLRAAASLERRSRRRPVPVLVDSRYRLLDYRGFTTCTPNESEVEQVVGIRVNDNAEALEQAGRGCCSARGWARCSSRGAAAAWRCSSPGRPTVHIPIFGSDEVADVTGRGRHGHRDGRPGARRRRVVLRGGAAGQLRRRAGRHEARHGDGVGAGNGRCRDERSRHVARSLVAGRAGAGETEVEQDRTRAEG